MEVSGAGSTGAEWAERAYEGMATVYDDFTAHHNYEGWVADLLVVLKRHGLQGKRLLDVACGTGKSFLPMLPRGWQVSGCDISPAMVEIARAKADGRATLTVADMLDLPVFGEFDLVWALDDAINYLLGPGELQRALAGMRRNTAPSGLLLFDVNELLAYRTFFAETSVVERNGRRLTWHGLAASDAAPGSICEARLEMSFDEGGDGPESVVHRQRHFPEAEVLAALEGAGLECLDVYGTGLDGLPKQPLDVENHTKAIYVARRAGAGPSG